MTCNAGQSFCIVKRCISQRSERTSRYNGQSQTRRAVTVMGSGGHRAAVCNTMMLYADRRCVANHCLLMPCRVIVGPGGRCTLDLSHCEKMRGLGRVWG